MVNLFYTVTRHLDSSDSLNGIRTIEVYSINENTPIKEFELECYSDDFGAYLNEDEEEIIEHLIKIGFDGFDDDGSLTLTQL